MLLVFGMMRLTSPKWPGSDYKPATQLQLIPLLPEIRRLEKLPEDTVLG
ncbi:hypothetical protein [Neptunomonas sp.]|nr:hypothetical protein [Neptunomonas sp.]